MNWPWSRETRADATDYTSMVLANLEETVTAGQDADPGGLATVSACAQQWADWLSACAVTGPPCITRHFLSTVALDMVRRGASRWRISVRDGVIVLDRPSRALRVHGGWQFTWTPDPGRQMFEELLDSEVLNLRWEHDAELPWRGRPPWAGLTGRLAAELEATLADEAAGPQGSLLLVNAQAPYADATARNNEEIRIKRDLAFSGRLRGKLKAMVNPNVTNRQGTTADAIGRPLRIGPGWQEPIPQARSQLPREIAAACAVPYELVAGGPGASLREAHRLATERVGTRARRIADDLAAALGVDVTLDASELHRADIMSRTRSLKGLVDAGVALEEARRIVGLETEGRA